MMVFKVGGIVGGDPEKKVTSIRTLIIETAGGVHKERKISILGFKRDFKVFLDDEGEYIWFNWFNKNEGLKVRPGRW